MDEEEIITIESTEEELVLIEGTEEEKDEILAYWDEVTEEEDNK